MHNDPFHTSAADLHDCLEHTRTALVCGSRTFPVTDATIQRLANLLEARGIGHVIQGGAHGGDLVGDLAARRVGIPVTCVPADWQKFGRSAGFRRNEIMVRMLQHDDMVIALIDKPLADSRGTAHTVRLARESRTTLESMVLRYYDR